LNVHFIAIGGAAMHNLAIALKKKGYQVTGSDDEIFDPSKSRLDKHGLLPNKMGWDETKIHPELDAVILGMHARKDNPELLKAEKIGLKIFSYPEYIYEQSKNKNRIVIGGSHGKTSITAMILHALDKMNVDVDYMVGAQLDGFDCMVKLTDSAKHIVLEGDEYLSSPIDLRPKFHLYKPNVALLSGIAWDHINVFPTFENYVDQFNQFIHLIEPGGKLIHYEGDDNISRLVDKAPSSITAAAYGLPKHSIKNGVSYIHYKEDKIGMEIFGEHNLQNLNGARLVCNTLGVSDSEFYHAMKSFTGAAKRLELIYRGDDTVFYKDFAHSPSKLKATTKALKNQYPDRALVACMELHTFSSLNKEFLPQYKGSMDSVDLPFVFFDPEVIKHKRLPEVDLEEIRAAFEHPNLQVYTDSSKLMEALTETNWIGKNLLMMSSGNFKGLHFPQIANDLFQV